MNKISKELWAKIKESYPEQFEIFKKWIDKYKTEVNWNSLLGINLKFHDLPFEMQIGILLRFQQELVGEAEIWEAEIANELSQKEGLIHIFKSIREYNETKS